MTPELDIVIPVHNEGRNIVATLASLASSLTTPARVLICYDHPDDDTLPAIRDNAASHAGLPARAIYPLGKTFPCTGRLSNRIHSFFVESGERVARFKPEPGLEVKLVSPTELARLIRSGTFRSQLHIGALLLAELAGFLTLPRSPKRRRSRVARKTEAR